MYHPITTFIISSIAIAAASKEFDPLVPEGYNEQVSSEILSDLTEVYVDIFQLKLVDISTKAMEILAEVQFAVTWEDKRLIDADLKSDVAILPKNIAKKLWYPRLTFPNCRGCDKVLINPDDDEFVYTKNLKQLSVSQRQTKQFNCPFELSKYPFDKQVCQIGYHITVLNKDNVTLRANDSTTKCLLNDTQIQPEFELIYVNINKTNVPHDNIIILCLNYDIKIRRVSARYIFIIFIPSFLIVLISWIAFWLESGAFATRISLCLTVLLTLITHFNTAQRDLPLVSTTTAVDVWMFFCLINVFSSLIVVATSYYANFIAESKKVTPIVVTSASQNGHTKNNQEEKPKPTTSKLDLASRVIFPLMFISFNVFFWFCYCL